MKTSLPSSPPKRYHYYAETVARKLQRESSLQVSQCPIEKKPNIIRRSCEEKRGFPSLLRPHRFLKSSKSQEFNALDTNVTSQKTHFVKRPVTSHERQTLTGHSVKMESMKKPQDVVISRKSPKLSGVVQDVAKHTVSFHKNIPKRIDVKSFAKRHDQEKAYLLEDTPLGSLLESSSLFNASQNKRSMMSELDLSTFQDSHRLYDESSIQDLHIKLSPSYSFNRIEDQQAEAPYKEVVQTRKSETQHDPLIAGKGIGNYTQQKRRELEFQRSKSKDLTTSGDYDTLSLEILAAQAQVLFLRA